MMIRKGGPLECALVLFAASCAYPQVGLSSPADTPQASAGLEEVIVTANKREENINNVGATVAAISGEDLAQRGINSLEGLAAAVPGLSYSQSGASTPILTLRGIGFNESSLGVYPAVTVYVDEVPLAFPVMTLHSNYDLQRVEVLKGPQGTLFGENSTGGAINYVAAKPSDELEYGTSFAYGRFNAVSGDAYISGPVGDSVGMRLALTGHTEDGWQKSYTRPGDKNGAQRYVAARLITTWQPNDAARVSFNVNAWHDGSKPQAPQLVAIRPQIPATVHPEVLNYPFAPDSNRAADWSEGIGPTTGANVTPSSDRDLYQGALRGDFDLTSDITLTSLTSYSYLKQQLSSDQDGIGGPQPPQAGTADAPKLGLVANLSPSDGAVHTFNQELRVANSASNSDRWVVGVNFERNTTHEDQILYFGDDSNNNPANLNINTTGTKNDERFTNYAVFANNEFDLTQRLTLRAGARYTSTKAKATICNYANGDGNVATLFNLIPQLLGLPGANIGTNDCYALNNVVPPTDPGYFQPGATYKDTLKENNVSWKVGADFRAADDALFYANVSRGYKAGSYPTLAGSTLAENTPVTQESVTAYEIGTKSGLLDRKIQLNAAAFYYDYKDKQIRGKLVDPIFNILDVLVNVPKSRVYGAEVDFSIRPVESLTVQAAVTYLQSKIKSYTGPTVYGDEVDFSGDTLPFTPKWVGAINADYKLSLHNGGKPFVGVSVKAQSSSVSVLGGEDIGPAFAPYTGTAPCAADNLPACYRTLPGLNRPFVLPSYETVDLRAGYESQDGRWTAMLWGKNIFNKRYFTNSNQYLDVTVRYTGLPATYGLSVSFKN